MANKDQKTPDKDKEDRVPVTPSPTPNAVQDQMKEKTQDAKNPATIPYVEPMMQVTQVPNTYPPLQEPEAKTNEEATIEADQGPYSVEKTKGLERDPQHAGIVHSQYGHDRVETEAEKAARRGDAGVNLGQPRSVNPTGSVPSRRLSAEQEAGRAALGKKHSPQARENEKNAGNKKK
jgi:hypothetical protein